MLDCAIFGCHVASIDEVEVREASAGGSGKKRHVECNTIAANMDYLAFRRHLQ